VSLRDRNPFVALDDAPITEADLRELRGQLVRLWEDTSILTKEGEYIISVGNLRAVVELAMQRRAAVPS
jgi:hypothetical protein